MNSPKEAYGVVIAGGSVTNLARLETVDGALVTPADIASASYTIAEHPPCGGAPEPISGHSERAIVPSAALFTTPQISPAWTADSIGYSFRHEIDVTESPAFPTVGRTYSVLYRLTPTVGQPILFRYSIRAV